MKKQNDYVVFITDMFGSDMGFFRSTSRNVDNTWSSSFPDGVMTVEDVDSDGDGQSAGDEI
jgi:hypothetical protein